MIDEQLSEQNSNQNSLTEQDELENIKQQVCLNNHQLLELTYNDQKFYNKLKQFNHFGCVYIQKTQFHQALIYLNEAEKILEYAASCGKTIQRNLIITTLNNQASLYQKAWQIQKAQSYIQAIIYNISTFFENNSQNNHDKNKKLTFNNNILDLKSTQYQDFSISLWRKKSLALYYLQFCAVNSQNKNHENAFNSASKAVNLLKQVCLQFYEYQSFLKKAAGSNKKNIDQQQQLRLNTNTSMLYELGKLRSLSSEEIQFQQFYKLAVKFIACYIKRLHNQDQYSEQFMHLYKSFFQNYSIGNLMQINPLELQQQNDKLDLQQQISIIQKHYKAIYLSVGHFILATQARFISTEKYTLDENERKNSSEYKQSQIYHLYSIVIATKYLLCQSGYFDHVVNSFRNHYKMDIMEEAQKYYEQNQNSLSQSILQNYRLFNRPTHQQSNSQHEQHSQRQHQLQQIQNQSSEIMSETTTRPIPQTKSNTDKYVIPDISGGREGNVFKVQSDQDDDSKMQQSPISSKHHVENQEINTKQFKTKQTPLNTAVKKNIHKKSNTPLTKSQAKLNTQQANKMTTIQHDNQKYLKTIKLMTSREKQNKQKQNKIKQNANSNAKSRSKRKSQYQFLQSNKKINIVSGTLNRKQQKKQTLKRQSQYTKRQSQYTKRQSDYLPKQKSRSKSKRIPTSIQTQRKLIRRKDSCGDLRKTKKVQDQYGISAKNMLGLNINEQKTSRTNNNNLKKSKNRRQTQDKIFKLTSPEIKMKKLKSPRNIKK